MQLNRRRGPLRPRLRLGIVDVHRLNAAPAEHVVLAPGLDEGALVALVRVVFGCQFRPGIGERLPVERLEGEGK